MDLGVGSCTPPGRRTIRARVRGRKSNGSLSPPQAPIARRRRENFGPTTHKYTILARFLADGRAAHEHARGEHEGTKAKGPRAAVPKARGSQVQGAHISPAAREAAAGFLEKNAVSSLVLMSAGDSWSFEGLALLAPLNLGFLSCVEPGLRPAPSLLPPLLPGLSTM